MLTRAQKANKKRLAKQSKETPSPREVMQSLPASTPSPRNSFIDSVGHPVLLAGISIIAGIVGVIFYAPALVLCVACVLLAFARSKALQGRGGLYKFNAYMIVMLIAAMVLLGAEIVARKTVRDYVWQIARDAVPQSPPLNIKRPAPPNSIPASGQFFHSLALNQQPERQPAKAGTERAAQYQPPPDSPEGALVRQMRMKLIRDAGDPEKIGVDVQWMREQFELGWQSQPPELAKKYEAETEETAKLILAAASNRQAVLNLVPHIIIDK